MKLIRLPSGPLACVFAEEPEQASQRGYDSGVYRAFSGSLEAEGESEREALEALDQSVRRLSSPPAAEITAWEQQRAQNDTDVSTLRDRETPRLPDEEQRKPLANAPDTFRTPRS